MKKFTTYKVSNSGLKESNTISSLLLNVELNYGNTEKRTAHCRAATLPRRNSGINAATLEFSPLERSEISIPLN